jgi:hypothetical protein
MAARVIDNEIWQKGSARFLPAASYEQMMRGLSWRYFFGKSGPGSRAGQACLKKPADEFRLTVSVGFFEKVFRVGAHCRLGDFKFCGGGEKAVAKFGKNAPFGRAR